MRRLLTAAVAASVALPAAALGSTAPRAQLDRFACSHSSDAYQRGISVRAVMRAQSYPTRMALRFELLFKASGSSTTTSLRGGDLGKWRHPNPSTLGQRPDDVWRLSKPVSNLSGKGTYRFRVTFRWTAVQTGKRVSTTLLSRVCTEPRG